jgi:hypothetical protein
MVHTHALQLWSYVISSVEAWWTAHILRALNKTGCGQNPRPFFPSIPRFLRSSSERAAADGEWPEMRLSMWFYDTSTDPATGAARCSSLFGKGFGLLVVSSRWTRWTQWFTWFRPPERNTLHPREKRVVLLKPGLAHVSLFWVCRLPRPLIDWAHGNYTMTQGLTGGPWVI